MLYRSALLVLCVFAALMTGCASQTQQEEQALAMDEGRVMPVTMQDQNLYSSPKTQGRSVHSVPVIVELRNQPGFAQRAHAMVEHIYQFPKRMVGTLLDRGFGLLGTPYRPGGASADTGFDCSGFVSFLFREEAGIKLPRSTREMIELDVPKVARHDLKPGDILFFNDRGRGQVSHTGIYIGGDRFIHSSSRKSGGVRVDSLYDRYWDASYMQAKRVLHNVPDA